MRFLSDANERLGLYEEGIEEAQEALEVYRRLGDVEGQARSWKELAWSLFSNNQLDAAEDATSQLINLLSDKEGDQYELCEAHRILGKIYQSKGEVGKAINHFETALGIASSFNWHDILFWNNQLLANLFFGENRFDDAQTHIERAKSYATDNPLRLGQAMQLQAEFWYVRRRLAEAKSEALGAVKAYEKIGAAKDVEDCRTLLRKIETDTIQKHHSDVPFFDQLTPVWTGSNSRDRTHRHSPSGLDFPQVSSLSLLACCDHALF